MAEFGCNFGSPDRKSSCAVFDALRPGREWWRVTTDDPHALFDSLLVHGTGDVSGFHCVFFCTRFNRSLSADMSERRRMRRFKVFRLIVGLDDAVLGTALENCQNAETSLENLLSIHSKAIMMLLLLTQNLEGFGHGTG